MCKVLIKKVEKALAHRVEGGAPAGEASTRVVNVIRG